MALCPQLPEYNAEVSERLGLEFPVLQDRDNAISTMFRLTIETPPEVVKAERSLGLDLPTQNGNQCWDLPIPSRFAIDRNLNIQYASCNVDHRKRSDPADCLKSLLDHE